jgi:Protein of unknown function (DUF1120).
MKKVILATAIALCTTSAFAGETAVLKIKGTLTNAAYSADMSNGGVIDYGRIALGSLKSDANNVLGTKQLPITITCTAPTKVAFSILDDRADSNAQLPVDVDANKNMTQKVYTYGVGLTAGNVKIGNYGLWLSNATADGVAVNSIGQNSDWAADNWSIGYIPRSDAFSRNAFATKGSSDPLAVTTATFNVNTNLVIRDTTALAITDDTQLDGQVTMTLVYL